MFLQMNILFYLYYFNSMVITHIGGIMMCFIVVQSIIVFKDYVCIQHKTRYIMQCMWWSLSL